MFCMLLLGCSVFYPELFTGLHPQLVEESFITDMEQRYEQGQHLHTVACSSTTSSLTDSFPYGRAMVRTGGPTGASTSGYGALLQPHCSSISAASRGATAVVGSGICLRLHVLTRGLERLGRHRGEGGPESIGHCLERLHSSVEKMRRQHARPKLQELIDRGSVDDDSQTEVRGLRVWPEGFGGYRMPRAAACLVWDWLIASSVQSSVGLVAAQTGVLICT